MFNTIRLISYHQCFIWFQDMTGATVARGIDGKKIKIHDPVGAIPNKWLAKGGIRGGGSKGAELPFGRRSNYRYQ